MTSTFGRLTRLVATIAAVAIVGALGTNVPIAPAAAVDGPWTGSASLQVSRSEVDVHDTSAVVRATASASVLSPYYLSIYDDQGQLITYCYSGMSECGAGGNTLSAPIWVSNNATRTFTAYVSQDLPQASIPVNDVRAVSNTVSTRNTGWSGSVLLQVSRSEVDVHDTSAVVRATASASVLSPYYLSIYDDQGQLITYCYSGMSECGAGGNTLSAPIWVSNNATRTFTAYVSQDLPQASIPVNDVRATSNTVRVRNLGWNGSVQLTRAWNWTGDQLTLMATASAPVRSPYYLSIYDDQGRLITYCYANMSECGAGGNTISTTISVSNNATRTFTAYVSQDLPSTSVPVNDVRAISGRLSTAGNGPSAAGETDGGSNLSEPCTSRCHNDPVNSATGEFWETESDLQVPGIGPGINVQRSFATARKDLDGMFGYGRSSNYDMELAIATGASGSTLGAASQVRIRQENGSALVFTRAADGTYAAPQRVQATLAQAADGTFTFVRQQSQRFIFSASGRLVRIEDRNGQGVSLSYNSSDQLARVTDDRGRYAEFTWSGAHVSSVTDQAGRTVAYTYSSAGDLTRVLLPDGSSTAYGYDALHRMTSLTHPDGGVTQNVYDAANRVVQQIDPLGRVTTFAYGDGQTTITDRDGSVTIERYVDGQILSETKAAGTAVEATTFFIYGVTNQVESTTDPLGRVTRFAYDPRGNRTSVTDPLGRMATSTYDQWNNPLTVTNGAGEATSFTYDSRGNLVSSTAPDGKVTHVAVNADGTVASTTDPLGRVTSYGYDSHGYATSATGPDGSVAAMVYDSLGRLTSSTDPRGMVAGAVRADYTTTYTYDAMGRRLNSTDPLGAVVATGYDAAGRPTSVTGALGATTTNEYDLAGQLVAVVDAAGERTTMTYDGESRVSTVTDPAGSVTSWQYDALGRRTAVTDALGRTTHTEYDAANRVVATVQPSGARTTYTYDAADQLKAVTNPLGKQATTTFDAAGRPVTVTDADGRAVTTTYDAAGRAVSVRRADGSTLSWSYDGAGQVTGYTDASGAATAYAYDVAGRQATSTDTGGHTTHYAYDPAGLLSTTTYPGGGQVAYAHDAVARLTGVDFSDATPGVAYGYDAAGRTTSMTDGTGVSTYTYDAPGRLTGQSRDGVSVAYAWDARGNLTSLTYPSGQAVQQTYDAAGQLTKVSDWQGRDYTYQWTVDGQIGQLAYPNGVTTSYAHDAAGQVLDVAAKNASGANLLELAYGYTDAGLLASQSTTRAAEVRTPPVVGSTSSAFTWDPLGRIAAVAGEGAGSFAFDAAGSLTATAGGRTLTYDSARQLSSAVTPGVPAAAPPVTTTFTYDARGNRASATADGGAGAGTVSTTFDLANHLTSVTDATGASTSYAYDGSGLRASATTGSGEGASVEQFTWAAVGGIPALLTDASHAYVYGVGSAPLAQVALVGGQTDYLHTDAIGSVRTTTDTAGAVTSDADYDTYGAPRAVGGVASSAVTRFGYAGEYTDPTGLIYLRARYYDPASAQFLARDPLESRTGSPYGYTSGNPLQYTDPAGLWGWNPLDWSASNWVTVGLVLGGIALVATGAGAGAAFGLYELAASTSVALSATAAVTGTAAVVLDAGACHRGDRLACAGAAMGAAGVVYGGVGLAADVTAYVSGGYTFATETISGAGAVGGLLFGGTGLAIDLVNAGGATDSCG